MQHLIESIRTTRENLGYSQEYMAMKLGIGQNGYSKIELGYTRITVDRLFEIAKILNTDIFVLLQHPQLKEAV
ncbi:helix-turn-helix domain-containing protein [Mucilaginibacter calamicampi]|uniref:Helix-turn-helix domain-containing protein n=1 Tax=Mucilaginibacter calamicampi TaxID=1302352 RepID=A0ABW2YXP5_9SPHI